MSTFTNSSNYVKIMKQKILSNHTLEGVITLNKDTFAGIASVGTCIAIFTTGVPHPKSKKSKFINFENDGYLKAKSTSLIDDGTAEEKKEYLLNVWKEKFEAPNNFCVKSTIEPTDEWLHSFYYFNDSIPTTEDFEKVVADYLTFEVNMITHGRGYLFGLEDDEEETDE
ncbi:N-6 DNA methylase [Mycoplasmopsis agassizii]|uniref:N-6 DNA methylase n=1 Tax=Mycoplasmopsis agassizii TaxID=33922 RepID=UPI0027D1EA31|nr:N-6 DNA methylase [Mycoplasmopsis agassizii]